LADKNLAANSDIRQRLVGLSLADLGFKKRALEGMSCEGWQSASGVLAKPNRGLGTKSVCWCHSYLIFVTTFTNYWLSKSTKYMKSTKFTCPLFDLHLTQSTYSFSWHPAF